jgi:hemerythrin HHE cation binding domain-containing protein
VETAAPSAFFAREHEAIEQRMGRVLAAASAGDAEAARAAIAELDDELRRHTREEEERFIPAPAAASRKLAPFETETEREQLGRELRLEHVQIREIVGMMRRLIEERGDLAGARGLFGGLARRWDAHVEREVRELTAQRPQSGR